MDTSKLAGKIAEKGYNKRSFAEKVGIKYWSFNRRMAGTSEFTLHEVQRMADVLEIRNDPSELQRIFF